MIILLRQHVHSGQTGGVGGQNNSIYNVGHDLLITRGPSERHPEEFFQGYGEKEPAQTHHVLSSKSTLGCPHIFVLSKLLFEPQCLLSRSSMTPHSSRSRPLWTCTTAFSLHTLPVNSLSSTRSLMGNDVLSPLPHATFVFAYLITLSRSDGTKAHTCEHPEFHSLVYIFSC